MCRAVFLPNFKRFPSPHPYQRYFCKKTCVLTKPRIRQYLANLPCLTDMANICLFILQSASSYMITNRACVVPCHVLHINAIPQL